MRSRGGVCGRQMNSGMTCEPSMHYPWLIDKLLCRHSGWTVQVEVSDGRGEPPLRRHSGWTVQAELSNGLPPPAVMLSEAKHPPAKPVRGCGRPDWPAPVGLRPMRFARGRFAALRVTVVGNVGRGHIDLDRPLSASEASLRYSEAIAGPRQRTWGSPRPLPPASSSATAPLRTGILRLSLRCAFRMTTWGRSIAVGHVIDHNEEFALRNLEWPDMMALAREN